MIVMLRFVTLLFVCDLLTQLLAQNNLR